MVYQFVLPFITLKFTFEFNAWFNIKITLLPFLKQFVFDISDHMCIVMMHDVIFYVLYIAMSQRSLNICHDIIC